MVTVMAAAEVQATVAGAGALVLLFVVFLSLGESSMELSSTVNSEIMSACPHELLRVEDLDCGMFFNIDAQLVTRLHLSQEKHVAIRCNIVFSLVRDCISIGIDSNV